jgi:hypothetical protein
LTRLAGILEELLEPPGDPTFWRDAPPADPPQHATCCSMKCFSC